jgi:hypothetical protein
MKLLFISNFYPPDSIGGYEEICFDVAEGLKRRGHQVAVLTSCFKTAESTSANRVYRLLKTAPFDLGTTGPTPWAARTRLGLELHNARAVGRLLNELSPELVVVWNSSLVGRAWLWLVEERANTVHYLSDAGLALRELRPGPGITLRQRVFCRLLGLKGTAIARGRQMIF